MLKTQPGITTGSYNICIQVNDFFNDSYQEAFTITITDASQGGTYDFSASSTSLIDGDPAGTLLGTLLTSGGANPLFALVDNGSYPDNQFFSISGNQVIFTGTANLGQKSEFVIKVMVTAPDGTQHTEEIHVRIYSDGATAGAIPGQHRYFILTGDTLIFDPELTDIFSSFASGWSFHELVQMPSHGTAETGSIIYHSNPNFNGVENISYRICDNAGYCMLVDVNIVVESSGLPLPFSGFAPSVITKLPDQVHEYTDSKLILRIPKLSIETEIVGVPYS